MPFDASFEQTTKDATGAASRSQSEPWQAELARSVDAVKTTSTAVMTEYPRLTLVAGGAGVVAAAVVTRAGIIKGLNYFKPLVPDVPETLAAIESRALSGANQMEAPAFKVLTADGRAPWCRSEKWPLPTLKDDGTWKPGEWKIATRSTSLQLLARPWNPGLHVARDAHDWVEESGSKSLKVYMAEIGDSASLAKWNDLGVIRREVNAKVVRLIRPLNDQEVWETSKSYRWHGYKTEKEHAQAMDEMYAGFKKRRG